MGLGPSDGRLIRPIDEPTTAQVHFDWATVHAEALTAPRRAAAAEVADQAARAGADRRPQPAAAAARRRGPLPLAGRRRRADRLRTATACRRSAPTPTPSRSLTSGDLPGMGTRPAVHHAARLPPRPCRPCGITSCCWPANGRCCRTWNWKFRTNWATPSATSTSTTGVAQTNFNRRAAAEDEVEAVETLYEVGQITLDRVLDAQSRQAEAESAYYRSLVDYNRAIMRLHFRKGSLLEYNGVYLAEGPWPGKAYFDALRRARQRDASLYIDYGYHASRRDQPRTASRRFRARRPAACTKVR